MIVLDKTDQMSRLMEPDQEEERLQGLRELAATKPENLISELLSALGDPSWRVRKEAEEILLALPAVESLAGEVIELLHSEDNAGLRNAAVEILVRLGRCAVPELLAELKCQDPDVRKFVLDILGEIGDETVIRSILTALDDDDDNVRSAAAENLGKIGGVEAVPALLKAMEHPNLWFRFTVLEALGQIGEPVPVASLLRFGDDPLLRKALFDCLGRIGKADAVPGLVEGLTDANRNLREAAVQSLARISEELPDAVEQGLRPHSGGAVAAEVAELLASQDSRIRKSAARLLTYLRDERFASHLLDLVADDELCESAVKALIQMGPSVVGRLLEQWHDADSRTRAYLTYICGETGCDEGLDLLLEGLSSADAQLRLVAARALGRIDEKEAIAPLIEHLGDEVEDVREASIDSLCRLGNCHREEIIRCLQSEMEHRDPQRRMGAVLVLGRIDGSEADNWVSLAMKDESPLVRQAAVRALDEKGEGAQVPALMLALTDEDGDVRRLAAEALGGIGDEQAASALGLALGDEDIWVRAAAVRALGRLGSGEVVPLLRQALSDSVGMVAIAALETMAGIDREASFPLTVQALQHPDEEVVNAALNLLAAAGRADWIGTVRGQMLDHPHWEVRSTFVRTMAELEGSACLRHLEDRLLVEGEELVRQQIRDLIAGLRPEQG